MSSQHDDYVAYHNTVNAQNRSNYEVKYRLIGQIPLGIVGISGLYNAFFKEYFNWSIGVFSLGAIIFSLITFILLYYLLESSISVNEKWLEIAAKNQNLPPDKQLKEGPTGKQRYNCLTKWTRRACIISIVFCILLTLTIGVSYMLADDRSANNQKSEKETVTRSQKDESKEIVIVGRRILPNSDGIIEGVPDPNHIIIIGVPDPDHIIIRVPDSGHIITGVPDSDGITIRMPDPGDIIIRVPDSSHIIQNGVVTKPIEPKVNPLEPIPPPEQPTVEPRPRTNPQPESPPADKSTE